MKKLNLEEETKKYISDLIFENKSLEKTVQGFSFDAFEQGATSDYVKEQIILGQIQVLEELVANHSWNVQNRGRINREILELKAKLK